MQSSVAKSNYYDPAMRISEQKWESPPLELQLSTIESSLGMTVMADVIIVHTEREPRRGAQLTTALLLRWSRPARLPAVCEREFILLSAGAGGQLM